MEHLGSLTELSLYFLAAINPASKIFLLASSDPPYTRRELLLVSAKASLAALLILTVLAVSGQYILLEIFSIKLYSLKIAGGIVLFTVGMKAVSKGRFYEQEDLRTNADISIVPLAAPLIAGPATIAAGIAMVPINGLIATLSAITVAITVNFLLMTLSRHIGKLLGKVHAIGPIIRITGLIVMSMALQMILNGTSEWIRTIPPR